MDPELIHDHGYHLRGTSLWMDATRPRRFCFVSSGRLRPLPRHGRILATPPTARFCRLRAGQNQALITPFNRPFTLGQLRLELIPAGSMLGAAGIVVDTGTERVVYAGALGPLDGLQTAHSPQVKRCDVLVLDVPDALPETRQARIDGREALMQTIQKVRQAGQTPVVLVEPLGLAQEVIAWCQGTELKVRAHRSISELTRDYRRLDALAASALDVPVRLREDDTAPIADVVLFPPLLVGSPVLARLRDHRLLVPLPRRRPGRTLYEATATQIEGVSAHASIEEVQVYAEATGAKRIAVGGVGRAQVVDALRRAGHQATELHPPSQQGLFSGGPTL